MSKRADDIRKRIAKRKEEQVRRVGGETRVRDLPLTYDDYGMGEPIFQSTSSKNEHPLFKRDVFAFKVITSVILVLGAGVIFQNTNTSFDTSRSVVKGVFENEFQFAAASKWYEDKFGSQFALFPTGDKSETASSVETSYAIPASGKVTQTFATNGQGILVQTNASEPVSSVREGTVIFVGDKKDIGNTVVVQHVDGSEAWYGKLTGVSVKLYDHVDQKQKIADVSKDGATSIGSYYFAMKQDGKFVDPNKVISFE